MNDKSNNSVTRITNPNITMINGPVNVIRLEGQIHNIKKVIYLFMDYHINVMSQTECENIFSVDVQKYFVDNFYRLSNETNKMYDFFLEIYPSELANNIHEQTKPKKEYKDKYIEEVVKIFRKIFKYDSKKNKVMVNELFKNVRLHYLDIRDYYKNIVHAKVSKIVKIAKGFMTRDNINLNDLQEIIDLMHIMSEHFNLVSKILAKTNTKNSGLKIIKKQTKIGLDIPMLDHLANKIKSSYNHNDIKKIMLKLINESIQNFNKSIKEINKAIEKFQSYLEKIYRSGSKLTNDTNTTYLYSYGLSEFTIREMIVDIVNTVENIFSEKFIEFFARFTDIYFLRRFLDKDYITNAIVYTGAMHSNMYINILIKNFGFKITHASYSKIKDMDKLNAEIKKKSQMEIQELILPDFFQQCSNLTDFPSDFN